MAEETPAEALERVANDVQRIAEELRVLVADLRSEYQMDTKDK